MNKPEKIPQNDVAGPQPRHKTTQVMVGNVAVGGGAPIVVQSMTNTDTADIDGTIAQVAALVARRLGNGAHHGRPRRGRRRRAAYPRRPAQARHHHALDRRFPLHRPQAARRISGLRRSARQVPHQSRQCRLQEQARHPVRRHHRDRQQERQAGAHRRQLGLARPGAAHQADGREHGVRQSARCARGDARGHGAVGAAVGRARARARHAQEQDDPVGKGFRRAGSDRGLSGAGAPFRLRHPSRPHRSRHGLEGHRRLLRRARHPAAGRHRRHHPHFADAGARRRSHAGSAGRAGTAADHGFPHLRAAGCGMPRLRPHHLHHVPGTGALDPGFHPRGDAGLEDAISRRRSSSTSR